MSELKRTLGLLECTLMGVGVILGAGIYALVGQAALLAGNAVWMSFIFASLVASCTGLSYAELSSFIPKAGGEYYYARRALGDLASFLVSWLLLAGIAIAGAAVALGFAGYLNAMVGVDPIWRRLFVGGGNGCVIDLRHQTIRLGGGRLHRFGVDRVVDRHRGRMPKLGGIDYFATAPGGVNGILSAGALVFFAYIGFEEIVQLSEETRDATKNIPRAILYSIAITTVLYVLVALCAVSVLGWERLGASESPLADVVAVSLGRRAFLGLSIIALFSTANTVLILLMSASRLLYGMAEDGKMPRFLAAVHRTRRSPYMATLAVSVVSVLMIAALKSISIVANLTNFSLLAAFVIINLAVIVLRYREAETPRPFRVWGNLGKFPIIPLLGMLTSLFMLCYVGWEAIVAGLILGVVGMLAYAAPRRFTRNTTR